MRADDKLTVIVLTNLGRHVGASGANAWGLTHGVAALYLSDLKAGSSWIWLSAIVALCLLIALLSFRKRMLPQLMYSRT